MVFCSEWLPGKPLQSGAAEQDVEDQAEENPRGDLFLAANSQCKGPEPGTTWQGLDGATGSGSRFKQGRERVGWRGSRKPS